MKRSEMVKLLGNEIYNLAKQYDNLNPVNNSADYLIHILEKVGMLPPAYNKPTLVNEVYPVHAWEKEE